MAVPNTNDRTTQSRLARLMSLTTSSNDGEALNAVRAANALLLKVGATWADVLVVVDGTPTNQTIFFRGAFLEPPVGGSWSATALFLLRSKQKLPIGAQDRLTRLARRLHSGTQHTGPFTPFHAKQMLEIYEKLAAPDGPA